MDKKLILVIIVIIIAVVVIGGYFVFVQRGTPLLPSETQLPPTEPPAEDAQLPTPPPGGPPAEDAQLPTPPPLVRTITVTGTEFAFEPREIKVKAGERLQVTFINAGAAPHNFTVEELGVATPTIGPGQQATIEFGVPVEGQYPMTAFCSVPGHRERGMVGTLIVE